MTLPTDISALLTDDDSDTTHFQLLCYEGDLTNAQLYYISNKINIHTDGVLALRVACVSGQLRVVQWLHSIMQPILNVDTYNSNYNVCFYLACGKGHLELAQWLLTIRPDIDISFNHDSLFCMICFYGRLEVAQWLYQIKPDIDISSTNSSHFCLSPQKEFSFYHACCNGYLEMAQWLLAVKPTIDISVIDKVYSYNMCNPEIKQWLCSVDSSFSTFSALPKVEGYLIMMPAAERKAKREAEAEAEAKAKQQEQVV